jgi:phosphotransacetylase
MMERIVIEVDETISKKWRLSSQKQREKISREINVRLAKELMADSKEEFKQYLDELGATMKERGLTEKILQEILNDDK